ncbi:MAG: hypothetical protein IAF02_12440 [Anaerolineae bacterium]|nr:hypothetical protein [Anaerolineae bacterium]
MKIFGNYIETSNSIQDNIAAITAKEQRRDKNAEAYSADMDNIRGELEQMRAAFKDVVYRFAAILPQGWRVLGNFDDWVASKACADFAHGELQPDSKLMIGGQCKTILGLKLELEKLQKFIWELEP